MKTDEDDEFDRIKRENAMIEVQRLGQEIEGQPYHFNIFVSPSQRNQVLDEVANKLAVLPYGITSAIFADFVRSMKND
jgi:predicted nuclease of restriction endonuclease-like RecB superfamily